MLSDRIRAHCEAAPWVIEEVKTLEQQNAELIDVLTWAYNTAVDHDDRFPFDWAVYCEVLYSALNRKAKRWTC